MILSSKILRSKWAAMLAAFFVCMTSEAATVTWVGSVSSAWENGENWDNGTGLAVGDVAVINSGTLSLSTGTTASLNGLRLAAGTLTFSGGTFLGAANF